MTIDFHGRESVKLLEYMANSAAVLAMRTSETTFLDKTASGLLANDANEFYERLRRLIIDRDERDGLTSRGRTIVKDRDWNKLAAHYDCLLAAFAEAA
jgi:glycosyltransferase involved in cell wall biosynthesis